MNRMHRDSATLLLTGTAIVLAAASGDAPVWLTAVAGTLWGVSAILAARKMRRAE